MQRQQLQDLHDAATKIIRDLTEDTESSEEPNEEGN
jgi:hypothetical protein